MNGIKMTRKEFSKSNKFWNPCCKEAQQELWDWGIENEYR